MHYFKGLSIIFVLCIKLALADTQTSPRVVGGTDASPGDWPWMVALVSTGSTPVSGQFCGGSLINPSWVMTAAHCVTNPYITDFVVYAGAYDLISSPGTYSTVDSIHVHPDYHAPALDYDIALIKLSSPISTIPPVQLINPQQMSALSPGEPATVIGFGDTSSLLYSFPDTLQQADTPLVSNATCNINYNGAVNDNMLCAGYAAGGAGACIGDSGGPLLINLAGTWHQIGIVSWGSVHGCAIADYYSVYTRVSMFNSWIYEVIPGIAATSNIDFSYTVVGQSTKHSVSVFNNDVTSHNITDISLISATSTFTITSENCTQFTLAADTHCEIELAFMPAVTSDYSASVEINTDSTAFPVFTTQLSGSGISASDFDAHLGFPGLVWGTAGNSTWSTHSATSSEGSTSLSSQKLENFQSSTLIAHLNLNSNETVSFDWKVSSEHSYDYLEFWLDDQLITQISGEVNWNSYTLAVTAGNHTLNWRYIKDYSISAGQDRAWVDNIVISHSVDNNDDDPFSSATSIYSLVLIFMLALVRRYKW